ncbi:glycosyl hydrolase [Lichenihabitans sp. Uapishka_5]|uniref:glycosyl hydrolase n=1 Tax=Lichenihabitans sp. Uapishka_5 TaxID=3037302 RepID=UPI0029E814A3|nr:glycosyl hydrolase [Lichenihabitans sp. Uapishka_5]MDX7950262.1 glycosyl hydrolase [Lichenihabitans sp. Uapishka_5]
MTDTTPPDRSRLGVGPVGRLRPLAAALLAIGLWATSSAGMAAEPLWGVNGHPLTSYPGIGLDQQLDLLLSAGLRSYRVDVTAFTQLDRLRSLVDAAKARGLTILPVLIPPVDLKVQSDDALYTQSRQFAKIVVDLFKGEVPVWELGNETENFAILKPCDMRDDGTQYPCAWGPAGGVEALDYAGPRVRKVLAVLRGLSDGVSLADPGARRAMGSAGWGHTGIFDRMHEAGVAWDISVWHLYGADPEWAFKRLSRFGKPIWVTEFNHPTGSNKDGETMQAASLEATMADLRRLAPVYSIEAAYVYELCDEAYWGTSDEAFMGLVHLRKLGDSGWSLGEAKPAFATVQRMIAAGGK